MTAKIGFPPIAHKDAKVLILGSMPGEASLDKDQYYAHPQNKFWYIMSEMLDIDSTLSYKEKQQAFKKAGIAVWDVLKSCKREGSLDSSIQDSSVITNDFELFYSTYSNIKHVFFNGAKAEKEYKKHVIPKIAHKHDQIEYYRLPSTSPAMAMLTKEQKLAEWMIINKLLT
jgi:hypoxanthine-DNA glycosylase